MSEATPIVPDITSDFNPAPKSGKQRQREKKARKEAKRAALAARREAEQRGAADNALSLTPPSGERNVEAVQPLDYPPLSAMSALSVSEPPPLSDAPPVAAADASAASQGLDDLHVTPTAEAPAAAEKVLPWNRVPGIRHFNFTDREGKLLFREVKRYDASGNKHIRQQQPDPHHADVWYDTLGCVINEHSGEMIAPAVTARPLYNLKTLLSAPPGSTIYIVEGPNKAELLAQEFGVRATCNAMGAGKWPSVSAEDLELFRGQHVVVLPDNNEVGRCHAEDVARSLAPIAGSVKIVTLPVPPKGDIVDWYEARKDESQWAGAFLDIVEAATAFAKAGAVVGQLPWPAPPPVKPKLKAGEYANENLAALALLLDEQGFEPAPNNKGGFAARCPAHDDNRKSLNINEGDKKPSF